MYLHLGRDVAVLTKNIVGVFDLDTSTFSKHTKAFLQNAEKEGKIIVVCEDIPKSAVLYSEGNDYFVFLSQLSTQTLLKRSGTGPLFEA